MDLQKLRVRAVSLAKRKGYHAQAEDFSQEAILSLSQGRKANLSQLLIDYIRKDLGLTRTTKTLTPAYFEKHQYTEVDKALPCPENQEVNFDFQTLIKTLTGKDRAYVMLIYEWGMTLKEVGQCFGISEARVSQQLKEIYKKLERTLPTQGVTRTDAQAW